MPDEETTIPDPFAEDRPILGTHQPREPRPGDDPTEWITLADIETTVEGILGGGADTNMSRVINALDALDGATRTWESSDAHDAYLRELVVPRQVADKAIAYLTSELGGEVQEGADDEESEVEPAHEQPVILGVDRIVREHNDGARP